MQTTFSIITATYNSEKTLERTIKSVLNQSYSNFEYIIIDGNSSDKTLYIIKKYEEEFTKKKLVFKYLSENDKGIYDAWNKGIDLASGEWISFLGSDDSYLPNALRLYFNEIEKREAINYISSQVNLTNENGKILAVFGKKYDCGCYIHNLIPCIATEGWDQTI